MQIYLKHDHNATYDMRTPKNNTRSPLARAIANNGAPVMAHALRFYVMERY